MYVLFTKGINIDVFVCIIIGDRRNGVQMYLAACQKYGVVISSKITQQLSGTSVAVYNHGIDDKGVLPLSVALLVTSPCLRLEFTYVMHVCTYVCFLCVHSCMFVSCVNIMNATICVCMCVCMYYTHICMHVCMFKFRFTNRIGHRSRGGDIIAVLTITYQNT